MDTITKGKQVRPRIEGKEQARLIRLITDHTPLSPTQLINQLINNHYESIYPRGEEIEQNGNIKETQANNNK